MSTRHLLQAVLTSKKTWPLETGFDLSRLSKLLVAKKFRMLSLQYLLPSSRSCFGQTRIEECLCVCCSLQRAQKIPSVPGGFRTLPVHLLAVWTIHYLQVIYKMISLSIHPSQSTGDSHLPILRWLCDPNRSREAAENVLNCTGVSPSTAII